MAVARWLAPLGRPTNPPSDLEDSILLRLLVQALVTLGIASVAVAAVGVTQASLGNLLAIPLSALGAVFSWYRRRRNNVAVKFFIAFGMILALAAFFSRLLQQPGDTRIILAELLVQLQVLHSFDLPRRKDLGYSMMIGLILLGVAATISQTLAFGPLLLLFLGLALPVLVLDYQSRLGLGPSLGKDLRPQLGLRQFSQLLGLTLTLGLLIFLLLPRLPGYQIQSFPVSSTVDIDEDFTGQVIFNPGYLSEDQAAADQGFGENGGQGTIQGKGKLTGPGLVDRSSYYGFNQQMNQNLRGTMTPEVVMRVRSQAPGFWRVLGFDRYTGQGWEISRNDQVQTLSRSGFSYQTLLPTQPSLGEQREVVQTYTLVNNFPNLIPTLYQARELYFPTREVAMDAEGGLRSPVGLEKGMTYTAVSKVVRRDRTQLRQAPTGYSPEIRQVYLQVPAALRDRVRQKTQELLALSPQPLTDPYEISLYLAQALKQRYTLQPDLPFFTPDQDLVETFLFKTEGGYPDHFATVLTIMLRSIGIPARLAAGFGPGEFNPLTGFYVVRNVDAYAMTEVYFPQYGWFGFDPIPGHELVPPGPSEAETFGTLGRFWQWVAGWLPSPLVGVIDGLGHGLTQGLGRLSQALVRLLQRGWLGLLTALAGLIGLGFVLWLAILGLSRGWRHWQLRKLPPLERIYQQMLTWFAQQGYPKRPAETPLEYSQRLSQQVPGRQAQAAAAITQAYVHWRYGGEPQNLSFLTETMASLRGLGPLSSRLRWKLSP
ncbi:MAG TPA: DUF3488 domain-containing protein [Leptolyngbyaceae cyanobacterium M65_K2018_010]|nr:DUF3488 domain-containing protein [Leptolyngbyaceae cyanobacterium M65_K2018_010]